MLSLCDARATRTSYPACMLPVIAADRKNVCIGSHWVEMLSPVSKKQHMQSYLCSLPALLGHGKCTSDLKQFELRPQAERVRAEEAEAELEEVTWAPQISRMARNLRRPDPETELWSRLSKPAVHKNKVCCLPEQFPELSRTVHSSGGAA